MLDLLIRGGKLVDGTGRPAQLLDVGVADGRVVALGQLGEREAHIHVDAAGAVVSPGFIDAHSHSDLALLADPSAGPKTAQGVTTEIVGNCGWGAAPVPAARASDWRQAGAGVLGDPGPPWTWSRVVEYFAALASHQPAVNVATLVPHGAVRHAVMGMLDGPPSADELNQMRELVDVAMCDGAVGMSAGLVYPPGVFAQTEELEALAHVAGRRGGIFAVHLRSYGRRLPSALEEAIGIARRADVPLHVSHLSIIGGANAPHVETALARIESARVEGVDVTFDQQPYPAASSTLSLLLPAWVTAGGAEATLERLADMAQRRRLASAWAGENEGDPFWENYVGHCGWDRIVIGGTTSQRSADAGLVGRSLGEIARDRHQHASETAMDTWVENRGQVTIVLLDLFPTATIERIFKHPLGMVVTDAVVCDGLPHPRLYGTYPRVLGTLVREQRLVPIEEAVRKMTGFPAARFGLAGRGQVLPGMAADLVVFEPDRIADTATYETPRSSPQGIRHVFVNGHRTGERGTGEIHRHSSAARMLSNRREVQMSNVTEGALRPIATVGSTSPDGMRRNNPGHRPNTTTH